MANRKRVASEMRKTIDAKNHRIFEFRLTDSKDEPLIQLADMIAGAINAKYDKTKRYRHDYLRMIKARIDGIRIVR